MGSLDSTVILAENLSFYQKTDNIDNDFLNEMKKVKTLLEIEKGSKWIFSTTISYKWFKGGVLWCEKS